MFKETVIEGKTLISSDLLHGLNHYFTTKNSFLAENKTFLSQIMQTPVENFISPIQIHGCNIEIAKPTGGTIPDTDAVILTHKDFVLTLNFADCTPIILYDKKQHLAAGIHAGWRGTAQKIAQKTALKMITELNSNPQDIVGAIGPCIGKCCFEVGEEVINALQPYTAYSGKFVDLKETNRRQLEEIGITQIDISPYCTICNQDKFFSYRLSKTQNRHNIILKL